MHGTYYSEEFEPNLFSKSKSKEEKAPNLIITSKKEGTVPLSQEPHEKRARKVVDSIQLKLLAT